VGLLIWILLYGLIKDYSVDVKYRTAESTVLCVLVFNHLQVLTAASMKFRVFWDVAPCSHVEVDRRFRGAYCLHHQGPSET
jgi:hypothetical protein